MGDFLGKWVGGAFLDHCSKECYLITISRRDEVRVLVYGSNFAECYDKTLVDTNPIPVEIDHLKCQKGKISGVIEMACTGVHRYFTSHAT